MLFTWEGLPPKREREREREREKGKKSLTPGFIKATLPSYAGMEASFPTGFLRFNRALIHDSKFHSSMVCLRGWRASSSGEGFISPLGVACKATCDASNGKLGPHRANYRRTRACECEPIYSSARRIIIPAIAEKHTPCVYVRTASYESSCICVYACVHACAHVYAYVTMYRSKCLCTQVYI
jgi:hypothetical protein